MRQCSSPPLDFVLVNVTCFGQGWVHRCDRSGEFKFTYKTGLILAFCDPQLKKVPSSYHCPFSLVTTVKTCKDLSPSTRSIWAQLVVRDETECPSNPIKICLSWWNLGLHAHKQKFLLQWDSEIWGGFLYSNKWHKY